ncbi:MAG: hypothetical protein KGH79_04390 [Patescibacteria group bacterium]|nr:hypothetical protein [Patescibacteria group bacterium]
MKKALTRITGVLAAFVLPAITMAQTSVGNISQVGQFIIDTINNVLVPVIFAVAFIIFLWGAFWTFVVGANDEEVKTKGKNLMLWGLIGFFVMLSIWGLVNVLTGTLSFSNTNVTPPSSGINVGS